MHVSPAFLFRIFPLAVLLLGFLSCGGDSKASPPAFAEDPPPNRLTATIGDRVMTCEGRIANSSMTFNKTELSLMLTGQLESPPKHVGSELILSITKKDLEAGEFPFVRRIHHLRSKNPDGAFVTWVSSQEPSFALDSVEGTLYIDAIETTEEGFANYGVLHIKGRIEGTFSGKGFTETIQGEFEYTR